jgi:hypothetical protein
MAAHPRGRGLLERPGHKVTAEGLQGKDTLGRLMAQPLAQRAGVVTLR